jgi:hypothetical protein
MTNYAKLRGRIIEKFGSQSAFAAAMGWREALLSAKLNNKSEWAISESMKACELLEIPMSEAHQYFFCANSYENVTP